VVPLLEEKNGPAEIGRTEAGYKKRKNTKPAFSNVQNEVNQHRIIREQRAVSTLTERMTISNVAPKGNRNATAGKNRVRPSSSDSYFRGRRSGPQGNREESCKAEGNKEASMTPEEERATWQR